MAGVVTPKCPVGQLTEYYKYCNGREGVILRGRRLLYDASYVPTRRAGLNPEKLETKV
jgi:hypothetical protein